MQLCYFSPRIHRPKPQRPPVGGPGAERPLGGLFVNRAQAIKYALSENGHHPEAIVELLRGIELDMNRNVPRSRGGL